MPPTHTLASVLPRHCKAFAGFVSTIADCFGRDGRMPAQRAASFAARPCWPQPRTTLGFQVNTRYSKGAGGRRRGLATSTIHS